ncbi:MAG: DedA family protein [Actinomycetota bacterium]|jgi:membrane protein DedA with SNARE-associated domain|nr:DedA family protein [Actinomycetota bacterium]MCL6093721.1 DedA family protein [Actinomycetota bacterium]MDA8167885.1 DedA family protein [Actinomycetota bacterium]
MSPEAQHHINLIAPWVRSYGYFVAFFGMMLENAGIPVPAETALIILSFFASQSVLKIWLVIPIAILGDACGDNIGFFIGRFGGRPLVEKYGRYVRIDKEKLDYMETLFKEKGGRTVYSAHFFATTRITAALIAGISHMKYKRFLGFNLAAAASFVTLVGTTTYLFGKNLDAVLRIFHIFRLAGFVVVALIVVFFLYRYYQKKKHVSKHLGKKLIAGTAIIAILLGILYYFVTIQLHI